MSARPPIIIAQPAHMRDQSWRRFLAGLCLIEFFWSFVFWGSLAANSLIHSHGSIGKVLFIHLAGVVRAIGFLGLARALWLNKKRVWLWILLIACAFVMKKWMQAWLWSGTLGGFRLGLEYTPWMGMLVAAGWFAWRRRCGHESGGWAFFAAAWSLATIPAAETYESTGGYYVRAAGYLGGGQLAPTIVLFIYVALLIALAAALWRNRRLARWPAIILATVAGLPVVVDAYIMVRLVDSAIEFLMIASTYPAQNPIPWPWILLNADTFRQIVLGLPQAAGPWILIAWYVRNVPVVPSRDLPEDGSPFPRVYCWKCLYNLNGITSDRCPECGAELDMDVGQAVTAG